MEHRKERSETPPRGEGFGQSSRKPSRLRTVDNSHPPLTREQEEIWEKAAAFCVRRLPTLWTAGQPRREAETPGRWIVPIVLRYPDGHEGMLGELAFDESRQEFIFL